MASRLAEVAAIGGGPWVAYPGGLAYARRTRVWLAVCSNSTAKSRVRAWAARVAEATRSVSASQRRCRSGGRPFGQAAATAETAAASSATALSTGCPPRHKSAMRSADRSAVDNSQTT